MPLTTVSQGLLSTDAQYTGFKNRLINGDMQIDQRNNGATVTPSNETVTYITDRFYFLRSSSTSPTLQRSTDAPTGFVNSLLFTNAATGTTPTYAQIVQNIEGFNCADLGWGAAGASTVTVSFWVKSSLTGTFSVAIRNSASNRSYVSTYVINAANTWEQKSVTITGDTSGTWLKDNGIGINLVFRIGGSGGTSTLNAWTATGDVFASGSVNVMGTANATFQLTGVQLEKGNVATSFDVLPYTTELALCQRYYVDLANNGGSTQNNFRAIGFGSTYTTTQGTYVIQVPVPMRVVPSLTQAGTMYLQNLGSTSISSFAGPYSIAGTIVEGDFTMVGAVTANAPGILRWNNSATQRFAYSAEL